MKKLIEDDVFIYFFRKNFEDIKDVQEEADNKTLIEMNDAFCEYLKNKNFTNEQLNKILPKGAFDVILNSEHPLKQNGFSPAFTLHFLQFVKEQKDKYDKEEVVQNETN